MRFLLLLLLLSGCQTTALRSDAVVGLWLQRQHTLNTSQPCLDSPALLRCAEEMAVELADELVLAGRVSSRGDAFARWGRPGVCLVERMEPCRRGSVCAAASTEALRCAPRAGCTVDTSSWVARLGPDGEPYDYSSTLEIELRLSLASKLGLPATPEHQTWWEQGRTGVRCDWK